MNPGLAPRRRVARNRASDYWQVSTHLMESARTLLTLGDKEYGNAIGICIIHAVISANDAITIHLGEVRSSSEQHADAQRLLRCIHTGGRPTLAREGRDFLRPGTRTTALTLGRLTLPVTNNDFRQTTIAQPRNSSSMNTVIFRKSSGIS